MIKMNGCFVIVIGDKDSRVEVTGLAGIEEFMQNCVILGVENLSPEFRASALRYINRGRRDRRLLGEGDVSNDGGHPEHTQLVG